ncbi:hypothetical protein K491DRAFT_763330 [Lophiostoma macrostomum CBS 122681]|uniref:Cora-domain-containing protein n=1 Tax=Lophiostoma macrostomum CBS 122681 TaxID=1314788 RepID=A0A6A6SPE6_9PLEO|nr:hypothetical protein K491DRAFT_763330 [Lophiostoma macrostomum CBS 122681]
MTTPTGSARSPESSNDAWSEKQNFIDSLKLPQEDVFNPMRQFLERNHANSQARYEARLVAFNTEGHIDIAASGGRDSENKRGEDYAITVDEFRHRHRESDQPRLLLLQNMTPEWIKTLHEGWNVPLDFFLAHVENSDWYTLQEIPDQLPMLHSVAPTHVRIQYIVTREWDRLEEDTEGHEFPDDNPRDSSVMGGLLRTDSPHDSIIQARRGPAPPPDIEEIETATVRRLASGFDPTPTPSRHSMGDSIVDTTACKKINPFACVRNTITIWFDKFHGSPGWTKGVILMYPPFEAADERLRHLSTSIYRSFIPRDIPTGLDRNDFDCRRSHMDSFLFCLRLNDKLLKGHETAIDPKYAPSSPSALSLIGDLWRIVASEWLVFDTYAERSLNNIEKWFELYGEDLPQYDLHRLLSQLMKIQRRMTKYCTLVSEQVEACPIHHSNTFHPSPMQDFERIQKLFEHKLTRIDHAIQVAMSLMSAHEAKLAESRNAFLFVLTIVTSILLPFSTVAAIMAIPMDSGLGPHRPGFWKFWVSACALFAFFAVFCIVWKFGVEPLWVMSHRKRKVSNSMQSQPTSSWISSRHRTVSKSDVERGKGIEMKKRRR